jgi:hypothetical protein
MPFHRKFHPRHPDGEQGLSPKWFNLPKSPKSPKLPKPPTSPRPLTYTAENFDFIQQCVGCNKVEALMQWNIEKRRNGEERTPSTLVHNSFNELEYCAKKCQICRVFRQSLLLEAVTFDEMNHIRKTEGKVTVHWEETTDTDGKPGVFLRVKVEDAPEFTGTVDCNSRNEVPHLALRSNGRDSAVIEQAKEWLNICRKTHIGLCDNLKFNSDNPLLLIKILSSDTIQLCKKPSEACEYVALSYCWGDRPDLPRAEKDEIDRGKTTTVNLHERFSEFSTRSLPTTVRDALYIVNGMGIRYAWIDTLCVIQDTREGLDEMHKVYSNALFTLCACATTKATAKLLDEREAWTERTESCRLGGQWLTTPDMSLNRLRLKSPLAERAWTLQEERLSPRMLYVSSSRVYWSCASGHEVEVKPMFEEKPNKLKRPVYAASDRDIQMPASQEFLLSCRGGEGNLYPFWADIVKSYAMRDMSQSKDRLNALSGLAAKYLSANILDEYLAGIWAMNLPEGLAWKVKRAVEIDGEKSDPKTSEWPSWSWAVLPLKTAIENDARSLRSALFQHIPDEYTRTPAVRNYEGIAITRGEEIKRICVTGRVRPLWKPTSCYANWSSISTIVGNEERFTFGAKPERDTHAIHSPSGRVMVYENRKREVVCQLDFGHDVRKVQAKQVELSALEIGETTMLLLENCGDGTHRRVGAAWDVRKDFFALVKDCDVLVLR